MYVVYKNYGLTYEVKKVHKTTEKMVFVEVDGNLRRNTQRIMRKYVVAFFHSKEAAEVAIADAESKHRPRYQEANQRNREIADEIIQIKDEWRNAIAQKGTQDAV